jgi:6-phospho-beta-glucosidase
MIDRWSKQEKIIIADVVNREALPDLPPEVVVEVPVRVRGELVEPLPAGRMPTGMRGLVQAVKAYEELTIQAAVSGDQGTAIAALMVNPLVGSYSKAKKFLTHALKSERSSLPQFFEG